MKKEDINRLLHEARIALEDRIEEIVEVFDNISFAMYEDYCKDCHFNLDYAYHMPSIKDIDIISIEMTDSGVFITTEDYVKVNIVDLTMDELTTIWSNIESVWGKEV